jgi:hypothetical protein
LLAQDIQPRVRIHADDLEARRRRLRQDARQYLLGKPEHRVDVGAIIHLAGEDNRGAWGDAIAVRSGWYAPGRCRSRRQ